MTMRTFTNPIAWCDGGIRELGGEATPDTGLAGAGEGAELRQARPRLDLLRAMTAPVMIVAETVNAVHGRRGTPLSRRPVLAGAYTVPGDNRSGWVVVEAERDPARGRPPACARLGFNNLRGFPAEAGLR